MNKTLKISFSLKSTYRVNGILFSLKQIPLLKRLLPVTLYKVKGLKIFATYCPYYGKLFLLLSASFFTLLR